MRYSDVNTRNEIRHRKITPSAQHAIPITKVVVEVEVDLEFMDLLFGPTGGLE